jgi:hypothetical protein
MQQRNNKTNVIKIIIMYFITLQVSDHSSSLNTSLQKE